MGRWLDASNRDELDYWGIDELLLEPCCALKYYPEIELCFKVRSAKLLPLPRFNVKSEICIAFPITKKGPTHFLLHFRTRHRLILKSTN